ncbi:MAG: ATP-binding protein [Burkholderiales bacterium]
MNGVAVRAFASTGLPLQAEAAGGVPPGGEAFDAQTSVARNIQRKVLVGFIATAFFLLLGGVQTYRSGTQYTEASMSIARTQQIRAELAELYADVSDAESSHFSYLLLGDPRYREDARRLAEEIRARAQGIAAMVASSPQGDRLSQLQGLIGRHIDALERLRATYEAEGGIAARTAMEAQPGLDVRTSIRTLTQRMQAVEDELLGERRAWAARVQRETTLSLLAVLAGALGVFAYLFYCIRREAVARSRRDEQIRLLNADLRARVQERAAAHEALQASERRYRQFVELSPYAVFVQSDGRFVFANPKAVALFGARSESELLGRQVLDLLHPDFHELVRERMRRLNEDRSDVAPLEERWLRLDGTLVDCEAVAAPIEHEGRPAALVLLQEIAERKRLFAELSQARSDAEQANRAKSAFLAAMSHEIRTPMNGVIGMVEVLSRSRLTADQAEAIKTIRDSAFSLLTLIDDILDFSKIEAGRLELERTRVGLADMVEGICTSLLSVASAKGVSLSLFIDPRLPAQVWSDATRLRQVVYNLVGNAIKFSAGRPEQPGKVALRIEAGGTAPLRVAFSVADNGIGMAPDTLNSLFKSFRQGEISTTRRYGGTGLGLVISKRLVDLMHGEIAVRSTLGAGSTFTVTLPLEPATDEAGEAETELAGLSCVVVSSSHLDQDTVRAYLEHAGARVYVCDDLAAAARRAHGLGTPVVIHDVDHAATSRLIETVHAAFAQLPDARHLVVVRGLRRRARVEASDVVSMDGSPLRRRVLLRAVAVAAGRASPEVFHDEKSAEVQKDQGRAPTVAEARAAGRLILIAEDDTVNQKVILRQLALLGYAAEVATNGVEALVMWRSGQYALLLTDLHMPDMDGYALTETIRREEAASHRPRMPIVALTANALRGEKFRALALGMDEYLTKPMRLDVLEAELEKWLPRDRVGAESPPAAAPAVDETGTRVFDVGVLKALVGDDEEAVDEFLSDYLASAAGLVAELRADMRESDPARIGAIAHRLKSASRSVGALVLGDLCGELERLSESGDGTAVGSRLPELEVAWAAVRTQIANAVAGNNKKENSP